ncbi:unnamed protein product, partial [Vitis vinifera]
MYPSVPSPSLPPSSAHHSGPLEYYHPPPPQSAPIPYPYPYPVSPMPLSSPQPSLQQHSSFQYGSSHYHYQQPESYPPSETYSHAPGRANSFSSHSSGSFGMGSSPNHEVVHDSSPLYPPIYPQLDDHLSNLHLSDNHASAPASPSAPSVRDSPPRYPSLSGSNSFSSGWESYSGRQDSSLHSAYYHSSSFNGSQHSQNLQIVPSKGSLKVLLLHGNLDICVNEAKNLPNMDMFHKTLGDITSDPYVSISVSGAVIGRTFVISNSENPIWKQKFYVPVAHHAAEVHFMVKDNYLGVPGTYFPLRRGGTVTLYQDAHVPDGCLPSPMLAQGTPYVHGKCWHDIFDAICQAQRLIYITGWSVWDKVRLVRDASSAAEYTLGELLKSKSQEGVRVLLLLWDDPTSRNILGYKTDGIMQTHDEETRRFFKHSSVQVLLCPRFAGKRHSWIKQREVETIYTHHQKTVILDADAGCNRRKIIAFVGGLDLCDGRYDTPHHPLFRSLEKEHKDDYHNPTFTGNVAGCPREPWHDMHCKIDGPAAYDVLTNFQERWLKAAKPHGIKKLKMSYDDALLKIERIPDILGISDAPCLGENDPEAWHVQVFRSIDSNSVKGFPKDSRDALQKNLVCGKNVLIDMSIHTAYVKAIRAAQHFIYIENQYFIGSSFNWTSYKNLGADNIIPMEIALKIANKIRANERFAAYIVVPMWPEGVPTGAATQRILFWQHKTMQMMYETIYKALVEVGLEEAFTPQDYLNFFCLGNREAVDGSETPGTTSPTAANTPQAHSRKNRRFMIYVHSKGMIVDDEYVILGSANINQRSMEGTRDTEIAMGAYQPHYTWARKLSNPRGQIYGYRMSLWAEHTGTIEDCFVEPESLECVKRVRSMGEMNWKQFASDDISEMRGHLLKYPVEVDRKGKVKPIPKCETFPDAGGNIVGSFLAIQENLTI